MGISNEAGQDSPGKAADVVNLDRGQASVATFYEEVEVSETTFHIREVGDGEVAGGQGHAVVEGKSTTTVTNVEVVTSSSGGALGQELGQNSEPQLPHSAPSGPADHSSWGGDVLPNDRGTVLDAIQAPGMSFGANSLTLEEEIRTDNNALPSEYADAFQNPNGNGRPVSLAEGSRPDPMVHDGVAQEADAAGNAAGNVSAHADQKVQLEAPDAAYLSMKMEHKLSAGDIVEALTNEEGLRGAWFSGTIVRIENSVALIKFDELLDDDGEHKLEEWYPMSPPWDVSLTENGQVASEATGTATRTLRRLVRPVSSVPPFSFGKKRDHNGEEVSPLSEGDKVEVRYDDGWWEAVVTYVQGHNVGVYYPGEEDAGFVVVDDVRPALTLVEGFWVVDTTKGSVPASQSRQVTPQTAGKQSSKRPNLGSRFKAKSAQAAASSGKKVGRSGSAKKPKLFLTVKQAKKQAEREKKEELEGKPKKVSQEVLVKTKAGKVGSAAKQSPVKAGASRVGPTNPVRAKSPAKRTSAAGSKSATKKTVQKSPLKSSVAKKSALKSTKSAKAFKKGLSPRKAAAKPAEKQRKSTPSTKSSKVPVKQEADVPPAKKAKLTQPNRKTPVQTKSPNNVASPSSFKMSKGRPLSNKIRGPSVLSPRIPASKSPRKGGRASTREQTKAGPASPVTAVSDKTKTTRGRPGRRVPDENHVEEDVKPDVVKPVAGKKPAKSITQPTARKGRATPVSAGKGKARGILGSPGSGRGSRSRGLGPKQKEVAEQVLKKAKKGVEAPERGESAAGGKAKGGKGKGNKQGGETRTTLSGAAKAKTLTNGKGMDNTSTSARSTRSKGPALDQMEVIKQVIDEVHARTPTPVEAATPKTGQKGSAAQGAAGKPSEKKQVAARKESKVPGKSPLRNETMTTVVIEEMEQKETRTTRRSLTVVSPTLQQKGTSKKRARDEEVPEVPAVKRGRVAEASPSSLPANSPPGRKGSVTPGSGQKKSKGAAKRGAQEGPKRRGKEVAGLFEASPRTTRLQAVEGTLPPPMSDFPATRSGERKATPGGKRKK